MEEQVRAFQGVVDQRLQDPTQRLGGGSRVVIGDLGEIAVTRSSQPLLNSSRFARGRVSRVFRREFGPVLMGCCPSKSLQWKFRLEDVKMRIMVRKPWRRKTGMTWQPDIAELGRAVNDLEQCHGWFESEGKDRESLGIIQNLANALLHSLMDPRLIKEHRGTMERMVRFSKQLNNFRANKSDLVAQKYKELLSKELRKLVDAGDQTMTQCDAKSLLSVSRKAFSSLEAAAQLVPEAIWTCNLHNVTNVCCSKPPQRAAAPLRGAPVMTVPRPRPSGPALALRQRLAQQADEALALPEHPLRRLLEAAPGTREEEKQRLLEAEQLLLARPKVDVVAVQARVPAHEEPMNLQALRKAAEDGDLQSMARMDLRLQGALEEDEAFRNVGGTDFQNPKAKAALRLYQELDGNCRTDEGCSPTKRRQSCGTYRQK
eukprot:s2170_g3.t1